MFPTCNSVSLHVEQIGFRLKKITPDRSDDKNESQPSEMTWGLFNSGYYKGSTLSTVSMLLAALPFTCYYPLTEPRPPPPLSTTLQGSFELFNSWPLRPVTTITKNIDLYSATHLFTHCFTNGHTYILNNISIAWMLKFNSW